MPPTTQDDSQLDMQQLLDEMEFKALRRGEIVEGMVMRVDGEGIYLDIGHKEEGFKLGQWVSVLRRERDRQTSERVSRLEELPGWVWD